jgi:hypothetical protein
VIIVVPTVADTPVTTPSVLTVAIDGNKDDHMPPVGVPTSSMVPPSVTDIGPLIETVGGAGLTVTSLATVKEPQIFVTE